MYTYILQIIQLPRCVKSDNVSKCLSIVKIFIVIYVTFCKTESAEDMLRPLPDPVTFLGRTFCHDIYLYIFTIFSSLAVVHLAYIQ